ncbi:2-amino-4-hydroxy-6-hydroxymethyldihydropteridine diphosphokinase [Elusimicrobium posterum]|uniref:2-amino-4-hydroxy-6- hydroxymethyldihydropteridine diphosphokinase n=1 Tax=Elusimicrobium posterum TaxID=3116653 RepID=UPI003C742EB4
MKEFQNKVFIALGSNIGDGPLNIKKALGALETFGKIEKISDVYKTKPEGFKDQADFFNAGVLLYTDLEPRALLLKLKEIEKEMGRVKNFKDGPRLIDLDLIFYNDLVLESADLSIPHKMADKRWFVLRPLADIDSRMIHPVLNKSVGQMLKDIENK